MKKCSYQNRCAVYEAYREECSKNGYVCIIAQDEDVDPSPLESKVGIIETAVLVVDEELNKYRKKLESGSSELKRKEEVYQEIKEWLWDRK